ncbi:MAG: vWA domain-containing protein [Planctomycetota bacterium]|jgi:Ca-activated chloride channel family protein
MTLQDPWWLLLALLVPGALWRRWRRGGPTVLFAPGAFLTRLPGSWRVRLLPLPWLLLVAGILLAVVALARPVQHVALPHESEGIDIMLCLDTSSSMTANDMDPRRTRLDVARDSAARFIAGRPNDRIGLICFARFPDLRCPPTPDHGALRQFLAAVTPVASDGLEDATGIGTAVARAAQVLRGGPAKSKVVILLTDGEENIATAGKPEEIAPLHAGQLCKRLGVKVYAIAAGLGSRDTTQVRRVAALAGGRFFEARDAGAVAGVYADINALERVEFSEPRTIVEERFLPFLAAAVVLLLAGRLLQSTLLAVMP